MIILLFLLAQASANKPLTERIAQTQQFTDGLVDNLVDMSLAMSPLARGIRYTTAFRPSLQSDCERPGFHGDPTLRRTSAFMQSARLRCPNMMARAQVGDKIPDVNLHKGFPPTMVSLKEQTKGKKVVIVGLPGAFTPT